MELTLAIVLGALFGFALNRVGATNPQNIINMLRLSDTSLMKAILFAIGLSSIFLFGGLALGVIDPAHVSIKSAYLGVFIGGLLLGLGFALAGYCPGTGLAAAAAGRKDALFFIIGGLFGAFAFTLSYGWLVEHSSVLFDKIAGGDVSLAATSNEKYKALIPVSGTLIGIAQGIILMIIATLLPKHILQKK